MRVRSFANDGTEVKAQPALPTRKRRPQSSTKQCTPMEAEPRTHLTKFLQDGLLNTVLLEVDSRTVDDLVDNGLVDVAYRCVRHDGGLGSNNTARLKSSGAVGDVSSFALIFAGIPMATCCSRLEDLIRRCTFGDPRALPLSQTSRLKVRPWAFRVAETEARKIAQCECVIRCLYRLSRSGAPVRIRWGGRENVVCCLRKCC